MVSILPIRESDIYYHFKIKTDLPIFKRVPSFVSIRFIFFKIRFDWPGGPPGTDRCAPTQNRDFAPLLSLYCAPADKTSFTLRWFYINIRHQTKPQTQIKCSTQTL